jgi:hypothetical protein
MTKAEKQRKRRKELSDNQRLPAPEIKEYIVTFTRTIGNRAQLPEHEGCKVIALDRRDAANTARALLSPGQRIRGVYETWIPAEWASQQASEVPA